MPTPQSAADNPQGGTGDFASIDDAMLSYADPDEEEKEDLSDTPPDEAEETDPGEGPEEEQADTTEEPDEADEAGPDELKGGQFAPHDAKIRTPDGRVTTVAELLNGSMMLGDYREKTAHVAREREAVQAEHGRLKSLDTELQQQREVLMQIAQTMAPQEPDPAKIGVEMTLEDYTILKAAHEKFQRGLQQVAQQIGSHTQRMTAEQQAAAVAEREANKATLAAKDPRFTNPEWYRNFWNEAAKAGEHYGYTPEQLNQLTHPAHYLILRDALEYRRIKANGAKQKQQPQNGQPNGRPVLTGQRRPGNPQVAQRAAAKARFTKNPTIANAIDLID